MKNAWFYETLYPEIKIGLKIKRKIFSKRDKFQKVEILENKKMGKFLTIDGVIQTTEKDEFIYHEVLTHIPMLSHPNPRKVLIIGGGDGGILREINKYKIKQAVLIEIDKNVIEISKRYLKKITENSFSNPRVKIVIEDGANYVKKQQDKFDIVIIDSPDPIGPAKALFKEKFYKDVKEILERNGIMVRQSGSTFLQAKELRQNYHCLKKIFKYTAVYLAAIPTYIGGFFSFIFASNDINPYKISLGKIENRFRENKLNTKYYNPPLHLASFQLPNYVKQILEDG